MTQPTPSPELPDLDRLEALALAATPGPWAYQEDSDAYTHIVRPVASPGRIIASATQTSKPEGEANGRWIAAANPAAVLALIALARRAKPEGEAPQAVPVAWRFREYDDREKCHSRTWCITMDRGAMEIYKRYDAIIEPLYAAPAAQHAESGALPPHAGVIDFADEFGRLTHKRGWTEEQVRAILAAQSQGAQAAQMSIGFANNDQGVHVSVMQQHGDGSATVLHQGRVPAGDSFARFALAAKAEAPAVVFANDGALPEDTAHLDCTACGGSGHVDDQRRAQQAAAPGALTDNLRRTLNNIKDATRLADVRSLANLGLAFLDAAPSAPGTPEAPAWRAVTGPGQVEVGARLRFTIGDKQFSQRAKLILNAGTNREEVIYDMVRNFYFITSCVMSGFSNHKNVEYLPPKRAAQLDGGQGEGKAHG